MSRHCKNKNLNTYFKQIFWTHNSEHFAYMINFNVFVYASQMLPSQHCCISTSFLAEDVDVDPNVWKVRKFWLSIVFYSEFPPTCQLSDSIMTPWQHCDASWQQWMIPTFLNSYLVSYKSHQLKNTVISVLKNQQYSFKSILIQIMCFSNCKTHKSQ